MKRTLLAALLATGALVSAQSFAAGSNPASGYFGDENDLSWLYVPPTAKRFPADSGKPASPSPITHYGDETDLSWVYVPPSAKQFAESNEPARTITTIVHYGDENDLSWLYVPPTASTFRDRSYASTQTAPAR